eukprot:14391506-Alexandrium_andersonii.AAC.1
MWDETGQQMTLAASGQVLQMLPLDRQYLLAKLRGESTQGVTMSTMVHRIVLTVVNFRTGSMNHWWPLVANDSDQCGNCLHWAGVDMPMVLDAPSALSEAA